MLKRAFTAVLASLGAYAVVKGTTDQDKAQQQPQLIKVTRKNTSPGSSAGASMVSRLLGGLLDVGASQSAIVPSSSGGGLSFKTPQTKSAGSYGGSTGNRLVNDLMRDFGLTRTQAAGFVGNLHFESAGFQTLQEIKPMVPGSRGGYGYAQWTGPRRREFENWSKNNGLNINSYEANYGFLKHELSNTWEKRVIPELRKTGTVESATKVVQDLYLRPGIPHTTSRVKAAKQYA